MALSAYPFWRITFTGRAARLPQAGLRMYMAFQPTRFVRRYVAIPARALLPHVFTFTGLWPEVCFLWHLLSAGRSQTASHPLDGVVLCVVRTFLISFRSRDSVFYSGKVTKIVGQKVPCPSRLFFFGFFWSKFVKRSLTLVWVWWSRSRLCYCR